MMSGRPALQAFRLRHAYELGINIASGSFADGLSGRYSLAGEPVAMSAMAFSASGVPNGVSVVIAVVHVAEISPRPLQKCVY